MGHVGVVRRLYAMGCGVGRALFCAIRESQLDVVVLLLDSCRVNVDQRWAARPHVSPIEWAVLLGNRQAARLLLARGASIDRALDGS
eukprot:6807774-Prymnesium_polylepis.1